MTPRNEVMFSGGGHLYVYFTYGMHFCSNVVTEGEGKGCAVLIRAVEPIEGFERMRDLRSAGSTRVRRDHTELCNGPGNSARPSA
jgi:DNA-3-methyladenine glycosylase